MDLFTRTLDHQGRALELLAKRQQVLSANIANADTPGFKARDFDFAAALADARAGQAGPVAAATTRAGHLAPPARVDEAQLKWRNPDQASLDGNTVDLDRERANFADNAVRYEATLRFINGHVKTMLSAISGQS
ncbi:flagellar basal body rod protein FlgB [Ramlibacter sp. MAHUQ-53]|uniref:flagellar basal body rod protein FlgB n=1 Tax=unclassified Ramlibacter TaxID=2617605 RepID=UPI0036422EA1